MNGNIFIIKLIIDIKNCGNESMHSRNRNVGSEGVIMCHWTAGLIKITTLNMRTPIFKVACNKYLFIRTVTLLNTSSNELTEEVYYFREVFDGDILFPQLSLRTIYAFNNVLWGRKVFWDTNFKM